MKMFIDFLIYFFIIGLVAFYFSLKKEKLKTSLKKINLKRKKGTCLI